MATTSKFTIVLEGNPIRKEAKGSGAITPGDLLEFDSAGDVQRHSTDIGNATPMFAVEDPYNGTTTSAAVDVDYADNEQIRYVVGRAGDEIYAYLQPAGSADIGDYLESAGSLGVLGVYAAAGTASIIATNSILAQAMEAVSGGAANTKQRIHIRIV